MQSPFYTFSNSKGREFKTFKINLNKTSRFHRLDDAVILFTSAILCQSTVHVCTEVLVMATHWTELRIQALNKF